MAKETSDLVVCVDNSGYEAALERRKPYALCSSDRERIVRQVHMPICANCLRIQGTLDF
jgi:hypothetical protein